MSISIDLSQQHKETLSNYILFIKEKENRITNEVEYIINDFLKENIKDTVYNQKDIKSLFDTFTKSFKSSIKDELSYFTSIQMVYTQLLLKSADEKKVNLNIDPSQSENIDLIKGITNMIKSLSISFENSTRDDKKSFKPNNSNEYNETYSDSSDIYEKYEFLKSEMEGLKTKNNLLVSENSNLKNNLNETTKEIKNMSKQFQEFALSSKSNNTKEMNDLIGKLEKELIETKTNLDKQIERYQELTSEYDKKLSESIQFKQLRKFLNEKNNIIAELRKKIDG